MQTDSTTYKRGSVCKNGLASIIYAWAMDAPELHLPPEVAFKVGGDTYIQWIVLQVHYLDVSPFLPPSKFCRLERKERGTAGLRKSAESCF